MWEKEYAYFFKKNIKAIRLTFFKKKYRLFPKKIFFVYFFLLLLFFCKNRFKKGIWGEEKIAFFF